MCSATPTEPVAQADEMNEQAPEQVSARGSRSFEAFFASEYPRVVRGLAMFLDSRADAEESAQEAFARVFERWDRVSEMQSPGGYLYRVARNVARRRRATQFILHPITHSTSPEPDIATRVDVLDAVGKLSPRYRDALVLHDWFDLSYEDCASILGIAPVSVRVRIHRARESVRLHLGGDYGRTADPE